MDIQSFSDDELAQVLWNFNVQLNSPQRADLILVLGSNDIRVAQKGIELFKQGYAPSLMFSGNVGKLTKSLFHEPEALLFAKEAEKAGIPKDRILIEAESTNTGQNIENSMRLLNANGIYPKTILLVQKPYMLQRANATFVKKFPTIVLSLACPDFSFETYPNEILDKKLVLNLVVGDTQRLKIYEEKGFQSHVDIPPEVWEAFKELVKRGYTEHLVDET